MNSIRLRLIALFVVVTTTTLAVFAAYEQVLLYRQLETHFSDLKADVVTRLQLNLADPVWVLDHGVIAAKLEAALVPPDVRAVHLFAPDGKEVIAGVVRNVAGQPIASRSTDAINGPLVEADIFPPAQINEQRRKMRTAKVVIHFSRDRIDQTLRDGLVRRTVEVLTVNLLLLLVLSLSLRMVFVPLGKLRDALFDLATDDGEEPKALTKTNRVEFDEVIEAFNRTLHKFNQIIVRRREAETAANTAAEATRQALAQVHTVQEALVEKNRELEALTVTDRLTGLANRLRLDQVLDEEIHRGQRYGTPFSLVLIDIDHFKAVNDSCGHQIGDQVLISVARILAEGTRNIDIAGRWGGEEFLIVCRDTPLEGATAIAEKIRLTIANHQYPVVERMTASFGVTALQPGDSIHQMIGRADRALYESKEGGRNRTTVAA